jgi:hypothetical protein
MSVDVKSLLQEGSALTEQALEELIPSVATVSASISMGPDALSNLSLVSGRFLTL